MYKFRIPKKNQHWVYFYHSNLKVGPFGPPPVALELKEEQFGRKLKSLILFLDTSVSIEN